MDQETVGNIVLLAIVTLISVVQNGFFAHKVEHESKTQNGRSFQRTGTLAFERVYTANQNCVDAYPTFLVVLWSAGLLCSQVPAAFAGLMYLFVRQKYFVGYLGERTQSTPGYIFGKRIILFLFLMSLAGIFNYYLIFFFGSDFENYIKTQINGTQHRTRRDNSRSVAFLGSLSHLPVGLVLPSDLPQHPLNISTAANPYYNGKMFISACRPVPLNH
uniref:Arachidonate 5-lipoxygenase-activating protein n=2 Tax=Panthera TaxID=9688 RepID=A0A8C8Y6D9_PANLE